jgi:hypothetical protein
MSSCYAVMSPRGSLANSHQLTTLHIDNVRHGQRGCPSRRPAVGNTLHDTTKPARAACQQATHPDRRQRRRQHRQRRLDIIDEQELDEHAQSALERDELASSCRKTITPAHDMR